MLPKIVERSRVPQTATIQQQPVPPSKPMPTSLFASSLASKPNAHSQIIYYPSSEVRIIIVRFPQKLSRNQM